MVLGIGLDLCGIERIRRAIEKEHFLARVFTPAEQARLTAATDARRGEIAAGLFAAKEAVAKALGTGFVGFCTDAVEIAPNAAGGPECRLDKGALERAEALAGGRPWHMLVSITHEDGVAAATAIFEVDTTGGIEP